MTKQITCPKCGVTPQLAECDGEGHIQTDPTNETKVRTCPKMKALKIRRHVGSEIWDVQHVSKSPLLEPDAPGKPLILDRTGENLWLPIRWRNLLPHLKLALGMKGPKFSFRIITDQQIKNVFVGNEHYRSRAKGERDEEPVFNSVTDLVADPALVILKLGYIGHKNRAAAGALKEALLIREQLKRAVWIVDDPDYPWTHSCDDDVERYINTHFETVTVDPADPGSRYKNPEDDLGIEAFEEDDPQEEFAQDEPEPIFEVEMDGELPGGGRRW